MPDSRDSARIVARFGRTSVRSLIVILTEVFLLFDLLTLRARRNIDRASMRLWLIQKSRALAFVPLCELIVHVHGLQLREKFLDLLRFHALVRMQFCQVS